VIKVWELAADDVLRQQIIGLLPVIALMKHEQDATEKDIRAAIDLVQQKVEDAGLRAEMFAALYLFSGLKQLRALVTKLLKEANMLELLEKSETYQEIRDQGPREGLIYSIRAFLRARFGGIEIDDFLTQLQSLEDTKLSQLVDEAVTVASLDAFKKLLIALQEQSENGNR